MKNTKTSRLYFLVLGLLMGSLGQSVHAVENLQVSSPEQMEEIYRCVKKINIKLFECFDFFDDGLFLDGTNDFLRNLPMFLEQEDSKIYFHPTKKIYNYFHNSNGSVSEKIEKIKTLAQESLKYLRNCRIKDSDLDILLGKEIFQNMLTYFSDNFANKFDLLSQNIFPHAIKEKIKSYAIIRNTDKKKVLRDFIEEQISRYIKRFEQSY